MYQTIIRQTQLSVSDEEAEQALSELLQRTKPHLIMTEQELLQVPYGTVTISYTMRAGKVSKMEITQTKTWLADKQNQA